MHILHKRISLGGDTIKFVNIYIEIACFCTFLVQFVKVHIALSNKGFGTRFLFGHDRYEVQTGS